VFDEEVRIDFSDEEAVMEETGGNKEVIEPPVSSPQFVCEKGPQKVIMRRSLNYIWR
jgi:hypothetical protein